MRRLIQIPAALAALGLLILPGCKEKPSPAPGFGADVLATVNGDAIAVPEFYAAFAAARSGREAALPDDAMSRLQIKSVFLSELVDKKLLEQQAAAHGLTVTDPEIDARLAAVTADYPEGEFEKTMKESGRSHAALRAQAAYLILVDKLIERVIDPSVAVHPSEIEAEYQLGIDRFKEAEKVRASQILVDTETEAEGIVMQLYSGADFAELARTRSKAPEARKGGDLGFFAEDEMPEVIADAAFSMAVGQTSGVLKSPFGYHILRVTDRRAEHFVPVESVRGQLEKEVRRKKAQAMFTSYLEKLRAASDVRYNQDLIMSMELP